MDTDYDYGYDNIHTQPQPEHPRHNKHKPKHKRHANHVAKPIRKWRKVQKQRFFDDDRHLFYGIYECYWCQRWCSCCPSRCDNCKDPEEEKEREEELNIPVLNEAELEALWDKYRQFASVATSEE
jgi:hypothetical protein